MWRERWPEPPMALDVDTPAGTSRVYRWAGTGEPIIFLHGMGGTGRTWAPYVERLLGRDLYAIDTIGDVGRSQQREVIEDTTGLARWLAETLTAVGIERGHLVGTSYGGFLALGLATQAPERVGSLTLIDTGASRPSGSPGSCCGVCPCWPAPWRRRRCGAGWPCGGRCSRTRASCGWRCMPR